jgi:tetratricopeptide (TPR) repeat protein
MAYQSEIEKLEKQYLANPDQYFAPYADAHRKAGNLELALDVVKTGLGKRPNYLSAHIVLGRCLLDQKNDPEAGKVFEQVLKLDAENIIALRYLGEITERSGDIPAAQRWLKRLLDVDPMNDDAVEALKRVEAAVPPPPPSEPEPPPAEPAPPPEEPAHVVGFEATQAVAETPGGSASNDFGIEQSSSPFESNDARPDMSALAMDNQDLTFKEDGSVAGGTKLDFKDPEPETVASFDEPPKSRMPEPAAPDSFEPPMLMLDAPPPEPPPPPPEPEPLAELPVDPEPAAAPAARASAALTPASDLPLIMPDDEPLPPPAAPAPPVPSRASRAVPAQQPPGEATEPEPVITETMAEVYLKQGLVSQAREVYRTLVQQRPRDTVLRQKLQALEQQRATPPRGVPAVPPAGKPRFAAAETGGVSARSLFGQVLSARPGPPPPPPAPPARSSISATAGTALEAAFADEPVQSPGAPTRPTSDELSLAAVFGEEPAPAPRNAPAAAQPAAPAQGGFSFDEFFGGKRAPETPAAPDPAPPPPAESAAADNDGASPDDFVSWLKGLKS